MVTTVQITEVAILSIDKGDDSWAIEGEILFEEDLTTAFEVTYIPIDDELENLSLEITPGDFDKNELKDKIIKATIDFDE